MTPGRLRRLCQRIADTVDPDGARERRERAARERARVVFYRAHGGDAAMFAEGLPPDEALKSQANVQKRALEYKNAGIREKMDFLRVLALLDLVNGLGVPARLALWRAEQAERRRTGADDPGRRAWEDEQRWNEAQRRHGDHPPFPDTEPDDINDRDPGEPWNPDAPPAGTGQHGDDPDADVPPFPDDQPPFPDEEPDDIEDRDEAASRDNSFSDREDDGPGDDGPDDSGGPSGGDGCGGGPGGGSPGGGGTGPVPAGMPDPGLPTLANMTYPLATVLGEADRPGEAAGYGSLDPALVRKLADAAAQSPRSRWCITFTVIFSFCVSRGCDLRCPVVDSVPDGTLAVW